MRIPLLALLLLPACHPTAPVDSAPPGDSAPSDSSPDDTAAPVAGLRGGLQLLEFGGDAAGSTAAWAWGPYDRPMVGQIFGVVWSFRWEVTLSEGECDFVSVMEEGTCDPACADTQYCSHEDACEPWPVYAPAGAWSLDGLTGELEFILTERGEYLADGFPDDLFDAGATVTLEAAGGQTPAFAVSAVAPVALAEDPACDLSWVPGEPIEVTWSPGDTDARVRWEMISLMHAGNGPQVVCESDDDGLIVVPGGITAAYEPWRTEWETWQITRFRRGEVSLDDGGAFGLELAAQRMCFHTP
ncbi:MAG: hypothetical protein ABIO70_06380 [Pseudomonadota bacterium]